jgi:hypothetical protein
MKYTPKNKKKKIFKTKFYFFEIEANFFCSTVLHFEKKKVVVHFPKFCIFKLGNFTNVFLLRCQPALQASLRTLKTNLCLSQRFLFSNWSAGKIKKNEIGLIFF